MIANGYLTIDPEYGTNGELKKIKLGRVTQKFSSETTGVVLKLEVEVPDEVFTPTKVNIFVDEAHILAKKAVKVFVVKDE
jgi:hypothetical protein